MRMGDWTRRQPGRDQTLAASTESMEHAPVRQRRFLMQFSVDKRFPWLLVAGGALALEGAALFFQYGLKLDPCVLCVYQRVAVAGILLGGLIGALAPRLVALRALGYLTFGGSAAAGLDLALEHVAVQRGESLGCAFFAEFPNWAKLDEWFPAVFQPAGACDEITWQFVGLSMPQWMVIIFSLYLAGLVLALVLEARRLRSRP
jgi:disulfide bond formation protein DsbB